MIPKCKECEHCKMLARAKSLYAGSGYFYGRGEFFCEHPETNKLPQNAFGRKMKGFIGFGTPERVSILQTKTSPRWCPKRKED